MDFDEDAYELALIDEFDAPLPSPPPRPQPPIPPFVSAPTLRYEPTLGYPSFASSSAPAPAAPDYAPPVFMAGALYPSLTAAPTGNNSVQALPIVGVVPSTTSSLLHVHEQPHQPTQPPVVQGSAAAPAHQQAQLPQPAVAPPAALPPPPSSPPIHYHHIEAARPSPASQPPQPAAQVSLYETETEPLSELDVAVKQREIEREIEGYQQQLDYLAQALAGTTPHQVAERKRREAERHERDHQRVVATEMRVQHQVERAIEREQRREKVVARAHRASRSPSPDERNDDKEVPHEEDVGR